MIHQKGPEDRDFRELTYLIHLHVYMCLACCALRCLTCRMPIDKGMGKRQSSWHHHTSNTFLAQFRALSPTGSTLAACVVDVANGLPANGNERGPAQAGLDVGPNDHSNKPALGSPFWPLGGRPGLLRDTLSAHFSDPCLALWPTVSLCFQSSSPARASFPS